MYSYEDRSRAVKLYLKLGMRTALTIRQLGYPTKNALTAGAEHTNKVAICRWPTCGQGTGIGTNKNRRQFNITWTAIAVMRQP